MPGHMVVGDAVNKAVSAAIKSEDESLKAQGCTTLSEQCLRAVGDAAHVDMETAALSTIRKVLADVVVLDGVGEVGVVLKRTCRRGPGRLDTRLALRREAGGHEDGHDLPLDQRPPRGAMGAPPGRGAMGGEWAGR